MEMQIVPVFKDIFPEEEQPSLDSLIASIPTDAIIKCCCFINSKLYFQKDRVNHEIKIFIHLIERLSDNNLKNKINQRFQLFQKNLNGRELAIFPLPHTLKLIEHAYIAKYYPYETRTTPEQDLNLLKALLVLNSEANEKTIKIIKGVQLSDIESTYKIFWESLLPNSTIFLQKEFITSIYKSLMFLKFLNLNYPKYLSEYLDRFALKGYHEIPLNLFDIYRNGYNQQGDFFHSYFNKDIAIKNSLVLNISLDVTNSSREDYLKKNLAGNFKGLRTFPFLKLIKEEYHINNWGFIVEKFYEGLVFDFFYKTSIKEVKAMSSLENYKSRIGEEFTNVFFMDLMKDIFGDLKLISYKEKERNQNCDYDFYIRIKNHIFFFEFKDILFPLKETYEEIKKTLDTKLVSNQNESAKGISQIARHIESFNRDPTIYDDLEKDGITLDKVFIHPILVYSDHAFGMTGVNHYLNHKFKSELEHKNIKCSVHSLSMISIDFFMEEFKNFKSGTLDLTEVLNIYYKSLHEKKKLLTKEITAGNLQDAFSGFDSIIREQIPFYSKNMVKSVFFDRIIDELKPFLPKE
jgi:hypothetical protein